MHAMRLWQPRPLAIPRLSSAIYSAHPERLPQPSQWAWRRQHGGSRSVWRPAERFRRRTPPRRKDVPLFEISERVLELDAEDNPSVRPFDEETDGVEAAETWRHAYDSVDALSERLGQFAHEADLAEARMRAVAAAGPTPWRVTDYDIWSVALQGSSEAQAAVAAMEAAEALPDGRPKTQKTQKTQAPTVAQVLYRNGILARSASDPSETIEFLLHRQRLATKKGGPDTDGAWDAAMASCETLVEIRRLLAQACRTATGRAAIARNDRMLADQLLAYLPSAVGELVDKTATTPPSTEETTAVARMAAAESIAAMLLNASYCGTDTTPSPTTTTILGSHLCSVGLQAAAATGEPAAVQRFLDLGRRSAEQSQEAGSEAAAADAAILSALHMIHAQLRGDKGAGRLYGSRSDVFHLLTGACLVGKDDENAGGGRGLRTALVSPGGSSLAAVAPAARTAYLAAVAELGGVRTLWAEQHAPGAPTGMVAEDVLVTGVLRYAAYARVARNRTSAAEKAGEAVDASRRDLAMIYAYERAAADGPTARTAAPPPPLATLRPEPWTAQPLAESVNSPLREDVVGAFSEGSIDTCMAAIDGLLERHGRLRTKA